MAILSPILIQRAWPGGTSMEDRIQKYSVAPILGFWQSANQSANSRLVLAADGRCRLPILNFNTILSCMNVYLYLLNTRT